jgi:hypothetical protein
MLIQWRQAGKTLSGSLQQAILSRAEGTETSRAFKGTVRGRGLTLTLNEGLGSTKTLVGQVTPSGFTLTVPGAGKRLTVIRFAPGEFNDYYAALKKLESPQSIAAAEERKGSSASTPPGARPPTVDGARVERSIERGILAQSNLHATVSCPASVPAKKGKTFECTAITHRPTPPHAEVKTTFVVTIQNSKGYLTFESK